MTMTFYWGSGSPYSWRAMLALEVKGASYESKLLQFSKGEHKRPEFLALNPRGKVPTLVDGDVAVYESLAIMTYLERKIPDPPLFGRDAREAATIARLISEHESYLEPAANRVVLPLYFGGSEEKADEIREHMVAIHEELARLEGALGQSTWLAGPDLTAADLVYFPGVQSLQRAAGKDEAKPLELGILPLAERYPKLDAWQNRIRELPGFDNTYPPHWR